MRPSTPTRIVSTEEMRALDRAASEEFAVPSRVLMENAGRALAFEAMAALEAGGKVVIVCGPGNNGGDGLVAARHLANAGLPVETFLLAEELQGDAAANLEALRKLGGSVRAFSPERGLGVRDGDVVVDAVFGLGLTRPPEGPFAQAIEAMLVAHELGAHVVACDLPSGLHSDTGRPLGPCVKADVTVTFGYLKLGLALEPGASLAGRVVLADISLPRLAEPRLKGPPVFLLREDEIRAMLPSRDQAAHKGDFGHVLVVAGAPGKSGAAAMAAAAALRGGAGLVTLVGRAAEVHAAQSFTPELMAAPLAGGGPLGLADLPALLEACQGKTVLAVGPGLWRGPQTAALLGKLFAESKLCAVIDADALNALAEDPRQLAGAAGRAVLTPHPGEMARLAKLSTGQVQEDRLGVARRLGQAHQVVVLLKGARTVVVDTNGATAINPTGNPGMATAGCGDVLTGLIAALLAQGLTPGGAACAGAYVHGLAGDLMKAKRGERGLVATDLLEGITEVWASWNA
ncbi:MAG TPA: NAD(P)H-hydrate dehydratase [Myxococcales bacterium]|jgi:NAD(P)H-hydrate epimerase